MKIRKQYTTIILSLVLPLVILPFSYGLEPSEVIERCVQHCKVSGNVLAYKNYKNETIVLTSGNGFADIIVNFSSGARIITIEEVIRNVLGEEKFNTNMVYIRDNVIGPFVGACARNNVDWSRVVQEPVLDFHASLKQYRHAEIQVQAMYNVWNELNSKVDKSMEDVKRLEALGELLPALLVLGGEEAKGITEKKKEGKKGKKGKKEKEEKKDINIYSLFEACRACDKTQWLNLPEMKERFLFKILDGQYTMWGKYGVEKKVPSEISTFMSQSDLESLMQFNLGPGRGFLGDYIKAAQDDVGWFDRKNTIERAFIGYSRIPFDGRTFGKIRGRIESEYRFFLLPEYKQPGPEGGLGRQ